MGQDLFNEAYNLGYQHGKARAYAVVAIIAAAVSVVFGLILPFFF
jgi:hypothetical protein